MSSTDRSSTSPPPSTTQKGKKRKRTSPEAEELEIDVNLPEPPSKKTLRRAKKGKTGPAPQSSLKDQSDLHDDPPQEPSQPSTDPPAATTTTAEDPKRSLHGIWIGNLAFHITPTALRDFLTCQAALTPSQITRINLPLTTRPIAPFQARQLKTAGKSDIPQFQSKGFAYVDFDSQDALFQALQLTETLLEGRRVLIKDAKSFAGRPEKAKVDTAAAGGMAQGAESKPRSKRIFVGNLAFDVTRADLEGHFAQAGTVEDVFLASFEDTGMCMGYGWVRFAEEDEAERAVKGWVWKNDEGEGGGDDDEDEAGGEDDDKVKKERKDKKRKWWINKLYGRMLRCEFAEDASTRYKKRYGKGGSKGKTEDAPAVEEVDGAEAPKEDRFRRGGRGTADQRTEQRRQKHRDARKVAPGMALASAPRASGAIVEGKGTKVTFDD